MNRHTTPSPAPVKVCANGHLRTPDNVTANRHCRICERERKRRANYKSSPRGLRAMTALPNVDVAALRNRFTAKVEKTERCWLWSGTLSPKGYGLMPAGNRLFRATHISWFLRHGVVIPSDLCACHTCDNPRCVNPDHLFVATTAGNNLDRDMKQRTARGERQ